MPNPTAYRIRAKIYAYAVDPSSQANNVTDMSGHEGHIRLRVGEWRVVMANGAVIAVIRIGPRGEVYKGKPI